ncbi:MAG: sugar phosphate isomerase/epimerase family protein [Planctomycetaceae bacterium]
MRLSFYTYSYTDRLQMPTVECLERIARTGYGGIDVSGTHGNSEDPKSFDGALRELTRKTAARLGLTIEAVITHAQLTDTLLADRKPMDLNGSIDLAADLGAPVVTFHLGGYPEGVERSSFYRKTVEAIRKGAEYGAGKHVQLAVDGIWPTWVADSPATLAKMFDDVGHPNFGVNFDPSYLTLIGVDPPAFVKQFAKRIMHVHLKDHRGKLPMWTHLIPGRGEMNYARVFEALKKYDFKGSAAVECFTDMKFEEACDDGFAKMTEAAKMGGVTFGTK